MILKGQGRDVFELRLVGYEYAAGEVVGWHSSWLRITARASVGGTAWGGASPCLHATELQSLCSWLRAHSSSGSTVSTKVEFTEPELAFEVVAQDPMALDLRISMRLRLSHGADGSVPEDFDHGCVLRVSRASLAIAADDLAREAEQYPERS